jgi:hypothetical protein
MKTLNCNFIRILLIVRDSYLKPITLVIAFVHKETNENFSRCYMICFCAGIDLTKFAVFIDRAVNKALSSVY